ncbi:MAG: V-type ATP synthase subunit F [Candidatus Micrarchaeaceae archaeon]
MEKGKIVFIGKEPMSTGFLVYGIETIVGEDYGKSIESVLLRDEVSIVLLEEGAYESIKDKKLREAVYNSIKPLFIELTKEGEETLLRDLVIKAVGIDIVGR